MNSNLKIFLVFFLTILLGLLLETGLRNIYFRFAKSHYKTHHFTFGKYFFLFLFPLVAIFTVAKFQDRSLIPVFFISAVSGALLEWLIGYFYHVIIGEQLWTYHRFAIGKYTSYLSFLPWGLLGVMFWLLSKVF